LQGPSGMRAAAAARCLGEAGMHRLALGETRCWGTCVVRPALAQMESLSRQPEGVAEVWRQSSATTDTSQEQQQCSSNKHVTVMQHHVGQTEAQQEHWPTVLTAPVSDAAGC
jgi:hypothetical protein